jgi:hypothetical protein
LPLAPAHARLDALTARTPHQQSQYATITFGVNLTGQHPLSAGGGGGGFGSGVGGAVFGSSSPYKGTTSPPPKVRASSSSMKKKKQQPRKSIDSRLPGEEDLDYDLENERYLGRPMPRGPLVPRGWNGGDGGEAKEKRDRSGGKGRVGEGAVGTSSTARDLLGKGKGKGEGYVYGRQGKRRGGRGRMGEGKHGGRGDGSDEEAEGTRAGAARKPPALFDQMQAIQRRAAEEGRRLAARASGQDDAGDQDGDVVDEAGADERAESGVPGAEREQEGHGANQRIL